MIKAEPAYRSESILGEGSVWDFRKERLIWLDVAGKRLNFFYPKQTRNISIELPQMAGTVVPRESGGLVGALEGGFCFIDEETGGLTPITDPEADRNDTRFNDGKCDPSGRFWAGTMGRNGEPGKGSLYCLHPGGRTDKVLSGINISNGIIWSQDKKYMYYTDTLSREIWKFDYDDPTGGISNRRTLVKVPESEGVPDGMTIDAEGRIWAAHWEGGKVVCYEPDTGGKLEEINLPVSLVTSCAFGGDKLEQLFITTARAGLSHAQLEEQPLSGSLFVCGPGVTGVKADYFSG